MPASLGWNQGGVSISSGWFHSNHLKINNNMSCGTM